MTVIKTIVAATLQLQLQKGLDAEGNPVLGKMSYRNIQAAAGEQAVYDTALVLAGLQQHTLQDVYRINTNQLVVQ
ncbi:MAG: DUF1659 domain-containing protein [Desulfotomaculum sp.]|nr:DUF1659 domain-containing protein [Desulfotomaculum sp.]